jgi:hypothetical protein
MKPKVGHQYEQVESIHNQYDSFKSEQNNMNWVSYYLKQETDQKENPGL